MLLLLFSSLGLAWILFTNGNQPSTHIFPATITRDCAPWDGAAFTVKINLPDRNILDISIWQSPTLTFPTTYTFPDSTGQLGNALLIYTVNNPDSLMGTVTFTRVDESHPVEGNFKFHTPSDGQLVGRFTAQWDYQIVLCG